MGDFNSDNYKDPFVRSLVNFVSGSSFQSMFESFFLQYAVEFENSVSISRYAHAYSS